MRFACCITKGINTHSEYVILTAFRLQKWLHECASMLRYTYDLLNETKIPQNKIKFIT